MSVYQTLMNELKNVENACSYAQPIPVGMQVNLFYSSKGILTKVCLADATEKEIQFNTVIKLMDSGVFIQRLPMYKAECQVFGVLVAPPSMYKFTKCNGEVPQCFYDNIIQLANKKPEVFKFYAFDLKSIGSQYLATSAAYNRLAMMKFNVVPGVALSRSMNVAVIESQFKKTVNAILDELPLVAGIYVHGNSSKILSSNLYCSVVNKFEDSLDINGYIHARLECEGPFPVLYAPYNQIVQHMLSNGSFIIFDVTHNIYYASPPKMFAKVASPSLTCKACGKKYNVQINSKTVTCADPHCASKLYPQICRLSYKLGLPSISNEDIQKYILSGKIKTLIDLFDLDELKDVDVETTLANLIEAITPVDLLSGDLDSISKFVHKAGSATAVSYYIHNPDKIDSDLNVSKAFSAAFKAYWSDMYNVDIYDSFLDLDNINIITVQKKFEGDMIFRNNTICLTGEFKHGSYDEIMSILTSYGGSPVVEFSPKVNFVLVGHFGRPDPYIIECAQSYNIPVYAEIDFFNAYQIDQDLEKFHLI